MAGTCTVEGCGKRESCVGLCRAHYWRKWRYGDPTFKPPRRPPKPRPPCKVPGCPDVFGAKGGYGMCRKHYKRWRAANPIGEMRTAKRCLVEGCGQRSKLFGFCPLHGQRWVRTGRTDLEHPREPKFGIAPNGYRYVSAADHPNAGGNGRILEHRLIMSRSLGRPLRDDETVHHKNGDRSDNRLTKGHELGGCPSTCCNLELWSTLQPYGQRVEDKIGWAVELLMRYRPDALAKQLPLNVRTK